MPLLFTTSIRSFHICAVPILAAVLDSTSARTMSRRFTASPCAIIPPIDKPTNTQSRI
jgi:hypothetical protein